MHAQQTASGPQRDFALKDSGNRQGYDTGAVRDCPKGKGRFDLLSVVALRRLAIILEKGAEKYAARNWEQGIPLSRYLDSALRHTFQLLDGLDDEDHASQAMFNLMAFVHTEHRIRMGELPQELDDLPREKNLLPVLAALEAVVSERSA